MAKARPSNIKFKFILFVAILNTLIFSDTSKLDNQDKIYFTLGNKYYHLKEYNKAINAYQEAVEIYSFPVLRTHMRITHLILI